MAYGNCKHPAINITTTDNHIQFMEAPSYSNLNNGPKAAGWNQSHIAQLVQGT